MFVFIQRIIGGIDMEMNRIFYGMFFTGICLWQYPSVNWLLVIVRTRFSMHRNLSSLTNEEDLRHYGKVYLHWDGNHMNFKKVKVK